MKKRLLLLMMLAVLALCTAACGNDKEDGSSPQDGGNGLAGDVSGDWEDEKEPEPDRHHVEITVKDYGTITVELYGEAAPITVENFLKLAESGFYDGLTFHRIIEGFMMQGGDPNGDGTGGADENIKGEFSENGVENNLSHTRGAISMARASQMDSASSQFFIVHEDAVGLDGSYACFGYVTQGMEVVDAVCREVPAIDGIVAKEDQPIIESIKVID